MPSYLKKPAYALGVGDSIRIGGVLATIVNIQDIFHYRPQARLRIVFVPVNASVDSKLVLFVDPFMIFATIAVKTSPVMRTNPKGDKDVQPNDPDGSREEGQEG